MFLTVHSSIGAAVSQVTPNPFIAFILGFLSHFLLDAIPHTEPSELFVKAFRGTERPKKEVIIFLIIVLFDTVLWMLLAYYLIFVKKFSPSPLLFGMVGSVLPDYMFGLGVVTKNKMLLAFDRLHQKTHFKIKKTNNLFITGSLTQIFSLALGFFLLAII